MKEKNESTAIITPEIGIITPKIGIITPEIGIIIPAGINNIIDNVKSFSNFTLNEKT
ncbi:MAG: hypothetical protein P1U46_02155 [Patescibacteria group bacterium]|nr:hypothetical protein [Patescibacteria group bacterium]